MQRKRRLPRQKRKPAPHASTAKTIHAPIEPEAMIHSRPSPASRVTMSASATDITPQNKSVPTTPCSANSGESSRRLGSLGSSSFATHVHRIAQPHAAAIETSVALTRTEISPIWSRGTVSRNPPTHARFASNPAPLR